MSPQRDFEPKSHRITDGRMTGPDAAEFLAGRVVFHTEISPLEKDRNEDALLFLAIGRGRGILAVADGAGGMPGADRASRIALEQLEEAVLNAPRGTKLREAILDGMEAANRAVCDLGIGAATTLSVVGISDGVARTYHVGDSPILIVGGDGEPRYATTAHSPVGYAVESGFLDEEEAMTHEERHLLSNCVGVEAMWIELGAPLPLHPGDTILLASDGLFDNLHVAEIARGLADPGDLPATITRMVEETRQRMRKPEADSPSKPDDLTLLVYRTT